MLLKRLTPRAPADQVTEPEIKDIRKIFIKQRIFAESTSSINTGKNNKPTQLQLLESSYNLRYELPINKGN
jgi:hypothetical protein